MSGGLAQGKAAARASAALLLVVLAWCAGALRTRAEVPPEWLNVRVTEVRVVGEQAGRVDERSLGVPIGVPLNPALLREAIERLGREGRWADVQIDALRTSSGVALLFHLTPRLVARRVEMVGNRILDDREISRILGVRDESEIEREAFAGWIAALREAYAVHGYRSATPRIVLRDTDDPAQKVLRIEIQEGPATRISDVVFAGDPLPRRRGLRRVIGFAPGDVADLQRVRDGLRRTEEALRSGGYYAAELGEPQLMQDGPGVRVVIPSKVGELYEVRFTNTGPLSPSELFPAMALHEERLAGDANLRALEHRVVDTYRRYGFRNAKVSIRARPEVRDFELDGERWQEHSMVLDVDIDHGTQLEIEAITFPGAVHFDTKFLREQMFSYLEEDLPGSSVRAPVDSDVADRLGFGGGTPQARREVPRPIMLDPHRTFYEPTYEEALEHIRELYRADGYLDVQVGPVTLEPLAQPDHAVSIIPITEGPRTFLYDVRLENNRQLSSHDLLVAAALERGAPFSHLKLEEARLRIVHAYQERGFFYAKVEPRVRMSDDGTRAEVTFRVEEGYVVHVGAIEVRGAERSNQAMILNRLRLKVGEPYRPSAALATQDALLALDVFTSVTVAPDEADLPARVKTIVVSVTERKTQWLGWSAGFSTGEGVRGGFEYGYRNLFGSALSASFRGQIGYQLVFLDEEIEERYNRLNKEERIEYQATLSLGIPYIPRLSRTVASVDLTVLSDIQRDFRMEKNSVVGSLIYRPAKRWTMTFAEELEQSDFLLFEQKLTRLPPNLATSMLVPQGQNTLLSSLLTLTWDRRDRAYNPHKGVLISLSSEWARTLASKAQQIRSGETEDTVKFKSNMLRFIGSFAFYIPLAPRLTFASQWRYGRVVHLWRSSQSYPNRRFYLGGTNFRGFNQNQMIPQDIEESRMDASDIVSRGGETFLAGQNELRFPLFGDLYGGLFADIGNLWADPHALDVRDLETVIGAGLRFQTPVASLAFDYGVRALEFAPFDVIGAFQFAFQTF